LIGKFIESGRQFIFCQDGESEEKFDQIIKNLRDQYPKHAIQVVQTTHNPLLADRKNHERCRENAEKWAKSWVIFKDLNSSIQDVKNLLKVSNDFFQHLSFAGASNNEDDNKNSNEQHGERIEERDRIISLYLQKVDFSNQLGFQETYKKLIEDYISQLVQIFQEFKIIPEIVSIILKG
jgi:hypothetical protein